MGPDTPPGRLAIRCIRPQLSTDTIADSDRMRCTGERLGYVVGEVIEINPRTDDIGPWATVGNAITRTGATAVIVPDLDHVYGIDYWIRQRVQLITVEGERVIERSSASPELAEATAGA